MQRSTSTYLSKSRNVKGARQSKIGLFSSLLMTFLVLVMALGVVTPQTRTEGAPAAVVGNQADAGFLELFCSQPNSFGNFMDQRSWESVFVNYPQPRAPFRDWTISEAFANSAFFPQYHGEGGEDRDMVVDVGRERGAGIGNFEEQLPRLETLRTFENCGIGGVLNFVSSTTLGLASVVTSLTQSFSVWAFDTNLVCNDPANPEGMCFNLVGVIGGTNPDSSTGGIIGALTNSVYLPLLFIVASISAFWVLYTGIVKRRLREAFGGFLWVVLSIIIGLTFLLNPALLARAPMAISNVVGTCVIGAFNGNNCMSGGSITTEETTSDAVCRSWASGLTLDQQMSMTINSLSCSIWKAFILEPYSQGNFGKSFADLDTTNSDTASAIAAAGFQPADFCISLGSGKSVELMGSTLELNRDSNQVCNLAAYQLFLQTNAATSSDAAPGGGALDTRWYKIILTTSTNDYLWDNWAPSVGGGFSKFFIAFGAFVAAGFGGFVLMVISLFAMMFFLLSVILMAFAPLFAVIGVHPGKGRQMFIGWLEQIVSYILKYLASAVFLMVAISFYAAVLGGSQSIALTLLFIVILSLALLTYRREVIDLLGKANMGGQQLSSKFGERMKKISAAGVGGAVGGAVAVGTLNPAEIAKGSFAGIGDAAKRELKSKKGVVSAALKEHDRALTENKRRISEQSSSNAQTAANLTDDIARDEKDAQENLEALTSHKSELVTSRTAYNEAVRKEKLAQDIEGNVLLKMAEDNPLFAQAMAITNKLQALEAERNMAIAAGDREAAAQFDNEIAELKEKEHRLHEQIDEDEYNEFRGEYDALVAAEWNRRGERELTVDERRENLALIANFDKSLTDYYDELSAYNQAAEDRNSKTFEQVKALAFREIYEKNLDSLRGRKGFTRKEMTDMEQEAEELAKSRMEEDTPMELIDGQDFNHDSILTNSYDELIGMNVPEQQVLVPDGDEGDAPRGKLHEVEVDKDDLDIPAANLKLRVTDAEGAVRSYGAISDADGVIYYVDKNTPGAVQDENGEWYVSTDENSALSRNARGWVLQRATESGEGAPTPEVELTPGGMPVNYMPREELATNARVESGLIEETPGGAKNFGVVDSRGVIHRVDENTPDAVQDEYGRWHVPTSHDERLVHNGTGWELQRVEPTPELHSSGLPLTKVSQDELTGRNIGYSDAEGVRNYGYVEPSGEKRLVDENTPGAVQDDEGKFYVRTAEGEALNRTAEGKWEVQQVNDNPLTSSVLPETHASGMPMQYVEKDKMSSRLAGDEHVVEEDGRLRNYAGTNADGEVVQVDESTAGAVKDDDGRFYVPTAKDEILTQDNGQWVVQKEQPPSSLAEAALSSQGGAGAGQAVNSPPAGAAPQGQATPMEHPSGLEVVTVPKNSMPQSPTEEGLSSTVGDEQRSYGFKSDDGVVHRVDETVTGAVKDERGEYYVPTQSDEALTRSDEGKWTVVKPEPEVPQGEQSNPAGQTPGSDTPQTPRFNVKLPPPAPGAPTGGAPAGGDATPVHETGLLLREVPETLQQPTNPSLMKSDEIGNHYYAVENSDGTVTRVDQHTPGAKLDEQNQWSVSTRGNEALTRNDAGEWEVTRSTVEPHPTGLPVKELPQEEMTSRSFDERVEVEQENTVHYYGAKTDDGSIIKVDEHTAGAAKDESGEWYVAAQKDEVLTRTGEGSWEIQRGPRPTPSTETVEASVSPDTNPGANNPTPPAGSTRSAQPSNGEAGTTFTRDPGQQEVVPPPQEARELREARAAADSIARDADVANSEAAQWDARVQERAQAEQRYQELEVAQERASTPEERVAVREEMESVQAKLDESHDWNDKKLEADFKAHQANEAKDEAFARVEYLKGQQGGDEPPPPAGGVRPPTPTPPTGGNSGAEPLGDTTPQGSNAEPTPRREQEPRGENVEPSPRVTAKEASPVEQPRTEGEAREGSPREEVRTEGNSSAPSPETPPQRPKEEPTPRPADPSPTSTPRGDGEVRAATQPRDENVTPQAVPEPSPRETAAPERSEESPAEPVASPEPEVRANTTTPKPANTASERVGEVNATPETAPREEERQAPPAAQQEEADRVSEQERIMEEREAAELARRAEQQRERQRLQNEREATRQSQLEEQRASEEKVRQEQEAFAQRIKVTPDPQPVQGARDTGAPPPPPRNETTVGTNEPPPASPSDNPSSPPVQDEPVNDTRTPQEDFRAPRGEQTRTPASPPAPETPTVDPVREPVGSQDSPQPAPANDTPLPPNAPERDEPLPPPPGRGTPASSNEVNEGAPPQNPLEGQDRFEPTGQQLQDRERVISTNDSPEGTTHRNEETEQVHRGLPRRPGTPRRDPEDLF